MYLLRRQILRRFLSSYQRYIYRHIQQEPTEPEPNNQLDLGPPHDQSTNGSQIPGETYAMLQKESKPA